MVTAWCLVPVNDLLHCPVGRAVEQEKSRAVEAFPDIYFLRPALNRAEEGRLPRRVSALVVVIRLVTFFRANGPGGQCADATISHMRSVRGRLCV